MSLMKYAVLLAIGGAPTVAILVGCRASSKMIPPSNPALGQLKTMTTMGSTVDPHNGDSNPYGLAIAPVTSGLINADDLRRTSILHRRSCSLVTSGTMSNPADCHLFAIAFIPMSNLWSSDISPRNRSRASEACVAN